MRAIFETPPRGDVAWRDFVSLVEALGGSVSNGRGSRRRCALNDEVAVFHEPHPDRVVCKGAVRSIRSFLERAGYMP